MWLEGGKEVTVLLVIKKGVFPGKNNRRKDHLQKKREEVFLLLKKTLEPFRGLFFRRDRGAVLPGKEGGGGFHRKGRKFWKKDLNSQKLENWQGTPSEKRGFAGLPGPEKELGENLRRLGKKG